MNKPQFSKKEQAYLIKSVFEDEGSIEYRFDNSKNVVRGIHRKSKEQVIIMTYDQLLSFAS